MKRFTHFICLVLVACLVLAVPVSAETVTEPRASAYFAAHNTSLYKTGTRSFLICFDVIANAAIMQELGVSTIEVERSPDGVNWSLMRTYEATSHSVMICQNTGSHEGYVTYNTGTPGYYYRAYVTFYAKNSAGSAKLFRYTETIQL